MDEPDILLPLKVIVICDDCKGGPHQLVATNLGNICHTCLARRVNNQSKYLSLSRIDASMALFAQAVKNNELGQKKDKKTDGE